ncbi:MAG: hypothetical protein FJX75_29040 [Armatimonadetes bacterium]|nr:hypothetical protein [Armatimonadota bacterium]
MTERERFLRTLRYEPVDRRPLHLVGPWPDTLARWRREGLPEGWDAATLHRHHCLRPLRLRNVSGDHGPWPRFETRVLHEDDETRVFLDEYGRTVRDLKTHSTLPEWQSFPVTDRDSLARVTAERYSPDCLEARFGEAWEERVAAANASDDLVVADGGCYYWTIRSLAGVAGASYLFHDAPDLVDELCERYCCIALESLRRALARGRVDVIGFGEDIAFKTSTLISPAMFRRFIAPRYRRLMDLAQAHGIEATWYDSDGDLRPFIPDYLDLGIRCLAPCEVAAGMSPSELRPQYGRALQFVGGLDKREIAKGPAAIDAEIARNRPVILDGGYVPAIDHSVSADISYDHYRHFLDRVPAMLAL